MTNVPFDNWARPQVRDLLCFAEGSDQRGSHIADLYALKEESTSARITIWAADILSLMQSAFEEGWLQALDMSEPSGNDRSTGPRGESAQVDAGSEPGPVLDRR